MSKCIKLKLFQLFFQLLNLNCYSGLPRYLVNNESEIAKYSLYDVFLFSEKTFGINVFFFPVGYGESHWLLIFPMFIYLLECIDAMGSQTFRLGLNFSPVCRHMVPSLPPTQNRNPSRAATPAEDRRLDIEGTDIHLPMRGSSLSTLDW